MEDHDLLVPCYAARTPLLGQARLRAEGFARRLSWGGERRCHRHFLRRGSHDRRWFRGWGRYHRLAQRRVVARQIALHRLGDVPQQVKAVRYLHRLGCAQPRRLSIGPRPIPADYLDLRMTVQPTGHRRCRAIGQDINHTVGLQVDHNGAIGPPPLVRPIIDPDDPHRARGWRGCGTHQTEQRPPAHRHPLSRRMPSTRRPAHIKAVLEQTALQASSPPRRGRDQVRQPLREDRAPTPRDSADETTRLEVDHRRASSPRQIADQPCIVGMHSFGAPMAHRAAGGTSAGRGSDMTHRVLTPDSVNPQSWHVRKQQLREHPGTALSPEGNGLWDSSLLLCLLHQKRP